MENMNKRIDQAMCGLFERLIKDVGDHANNPVAFLAGFTGGINVAAQLKLSDEQAKAITEYLAGQVAMVEKEFDAQGAAH